MSVLYLRLARSQANLAIVSGIHGSDSATVGLKDAMKTEINAHGTLPMLVAPKCDIATVKIATQAILFLSLDRGGDLQIFVPKIVHRQSAQSDPTKSATKSRRTIPFVIDGREQLQVVRGIPINLDRHAGLVSPHLHPVGVVPHLHQFPHRRSDQMLCCQLLPFVCTDGIPPLVEQLQGVLGLDIRTGVVRKEVRLRAAITLLQLGAHLRVRENNPSVWRLRHGCVLGVVHTASIQVIRGGSRGSARIRERKTRF